jgi:hypothetical protein
MQVGIHIFALLVLNIFLLQIEEELFYSSHAVLACTLVRVFSLLEQ